MFRKIYTVQINLLRSALIQFTNTIHFLVITAQLFIFLRKRDDSSVMDHQWWLYAYIQSQVQSWSIQLMNETTNFVVFFDFSQNLGWCSGQMSWFSRMVFKIPNMAITKLVSFFAKLEMESIHLPKDLPYLLKGCIN